MLINHALVERNYKGPSFIADVIDDIDYVNRL